MALITERFIDLTPERRELVQLAAEIEVLFGSSELDLGLAEVIAGFEELVETAEQVDGVLDGGITVGVDGVEAATSELEALAAVGEEVEGIDPTVDVSVSGADSSELEQLQNVVLELDGTDPEVGVSFSGVDEATSAFGELGLSSDGVIEKFTSQLPEGVQSVIGALGQLNPAVAVTVAAFFGLAAIGDQFLEASNTIVAATNASGPALDGLNLAALNIADNVPDSLGVAADSIGTLNTFLAVTGSLAEQLGESVIDASRILGEDASRNTVQFAQALNQFNIDAEDGVEVMDLLFAATQAYGLGLGETLNILNTQGSGFQAAGLNLERSVNLIGQFNLAGLNASQLQAGFNRLIADAARDGRSFQDALIGMQRSIRGASTEQEAFNIGIEAFGSRTGVAFSAALRNGLVDLENLDGALGVTSGRVAETAAAVETTGESLRETLGDLALALEPVASFSATVLLEVVQAIGFVVDVVSDLPGPLLAIGSAAAAAALGFAPLAAAGIAVYGGFKLLQSIFGDSEFEQSLNSIAEAGDAYTESILRQPSANEEAEESLRPLIDAFNELNGVAGGLEETATSIAENASFAEFFALQSEEVQVALTKLADDLGGFDEVFARFEGRRDSISATPVVQSLPLGFSQEELNLADAAIAAYALSLANARIEQERLASVEFNRETGLSAYQEEVRDLGREFQQAGRTVTPFLDAQTQILADVEAGTGAFADQRDGVQRLNDALIDFEAPDIIAEVGVDDSNAKLALANLEFEAFVNVQLLEAEFTAGLETARVLVDSVFGNPYAPRIEEADILLYLEDLVAFQAAIAGFQTNILRIEASNVFSEDEEALLFTIFENSGKEGGAVLAEQTVAAIESGDFSAISALLSESIELTGVNEKLNESIGAANGVTVPVDIDVDASDLDDLADGNTRVDFTARLDDTALDIAEARELQTQVRLGVDDSLINAQLDALEQRRLDLSAILGVTGVVVNGITFPAGGVVPLDRGGVMVGGPQSGPTMYIVDEKPRQFHEVVIGAHHEGREAVGWLDEQNVSPNIEPIYRERFMAEQRAAGLGVYQAPNITLVSDNAGVVAELVELRGAVAALTAEAAATAGNTGALGGMADSMEAAAKAQQRTAENSRASKLSKGGWRPS